MANRKVTMTHLRAIVREFKLGTPMREIERKLKISRTSLRPYKERAEASGKTMAELLQLADSELHSILSKEDVHRNRDAERYAFMQANIEEYAHAMTRKYMTYEVLYEDTYCKSTDNPYGYTQFKSILQEYEKKNDLKYHNIYAPAHEMQFDFAGDPLWVVDIKTGECQKATVLVCVLPYSMMSFAIAMLSARMEHFFPALSKALEYFGGVPEISKTDNMLQWVKRYDRYEPALNEAAEKWAMHYGTDIAGCRSRKPRDKGPAEGLVARVYQFYYSRIYNETWTSLDELNNRILELNDLYNDRIKSGQVQSRREKFMQEEQPYLLPLPQERFMFKYEKAITVNSTYHFQIDRGRFYSVPYQYVGQKAKVVYDAETVEVWVELKRIAVHKRQYHDGYSTLAEHMPENHRAYAESKEYNAAYFQKKASLIGPETRAVIDAVLKRPYFVQQAYRACQGILRLGSRYTAKRLEDACRHIDQKDAASYKMVESILRNGLDQVTESQDNDAAYMPANDNVRGADAYK